ncbi:hypothetical protein EDB92DRAFT_1863689 [Lactarius akahatsu]|uniref:Uncharacterized protein n=1 Tax=Lactarius akahatsu TaxID=416441 RepID=A0AAD4LIU8_9AGAM|nr:hypothetical protein EDB92DRAFT_1863689 [Lactarius akahatsu]
MSSLSPLPPAGRWLFGVFIFIFHSTCTHFLLALRPRTVRHPAARTQKISHTWRELWSRSACRCAFMPGGRSGSSFSWSQRDHVGKGISTLSRVLKRIAG